MTQPTLEQFLNDVKNHELTIHQNNGVYRHLTFANPNDCDKYFNITTFPDYLIITGDMGALVFSRLHDMFNFFRSDDLKINPDYWAEKIESTSYEAKDASFLEFDIETVKESAREYLNDFLADNDLSNEDEGKLLVEFRRKILCSENEFEIREAVNDFDCCGFDFSEFWGCEQRVFTYRYIWLCYAIVWGIKKFDEEIMKKFWKGDRLELYDVPERIKAARKRVWSPYRDEDTIPIKIIKVYKIKPEYQAEYGKYVYKCKIMHDDVSTYDDIILTEQEIFYFSV